jgi:hypothetical protein
MRAHDGPAAPLYRSISIAIAAPTCSVIIMHLQAYAASCIYVVCTLRMYDASMPHADTMSIYYLYLWAAAG